MENPYVFNKSCIIKIRVIFFVTGCLHNRFILYFYFINNNNEKTNLITPCNSILHRG